MMCWLINNVEGRFPSLFWLFNAPLETEESSTPTAIHEAIRNLASSLYDIGDHPRHAELGDGVGKEAKPPICPQMN